MDECHGHVSEDLGCPGTVASARQDFRVSLVNGRLQPTSRTRRAIIFVCCKTANFFSIASPLFNDTISTLATFRRLSLNMHRRVCLVVRMGATLLSKRPFLQIVVCDTNARINASWKCWMPFWKVNDDRLISRFDKYHEDVFVSPNIKGTLFGDGYIRRVNCQS